MIEYLEAQGIVVVPTTRRHAGNGPNLRPALRCPQTYRRRRAGYFSDSRRCCLHAPGGSRGGAERRGIKCTPPEGRKTSHRAVRLGLHIGEVFYGNIGSNERLDFTVVGPAVYDVSRVVSMCRSVDRDLLASAEFCRRDGCGRPGALCIRKTVCVARGSSYAGRAERSLGAGQDASEAPV